jgi:hypothetical protein
MPNYQYQKASTDGRREIKSSNHFAYIQSGIVLDGSKFAVGEFIPCGLAIARNVSSGKFEKYADNAGAFPTGYDSPLILDEAVRFSSDGAGSNFDETVGQAIWHGGVIESMCTGITASFKAKLPMVRFD